MVKDNSDSERKEGNVSFNDALQLSFPNNILHEGRKEVFYLMTHATHFIYGYMASNIW